MEKQCVIGDVPDKRCPGLFLQLWLDAELSNRARSPTWEEAFGDPPQWLNLPDMAEVIPRDGSISQKLRPLRRAHLVLRNRHHLLNPGWVVADSIGRALPKPAWGNSDPIIEWRRCRRNARCPLQERRSRDHRTVRGIQQGNRLRAAGSNGEIATCFRAHWLHAREPIRPQAQPILPLGQLPGGKSLFGKLRGILKCLQSNHLPPTERARLTRSDGPPRLRWMPVFAAHDEFPFPLNPHRENQIVIPAPAVRVLDQNADEVFVFDPLLDSRRHIVREGELECDPERLRYSNSCSNGKPDKPGEHHG